jgi:hypothetical protein
MIEYEYTRVYINSLAMDAVFKRVKEESAHPPPDQLHPLSSSRSPKQPFSSTLNPGNAGQNNTPLSGGKQYVGNDRYYINEVTDGSRNLLKTVVEGLYPGDYLKHAPVRTFFRIISVVIILLKTFALGAPEDDVAISLDLLSRAVDALRNSIVDDVHVGNRFADLLDTLTNRVRARFVRMTATGGSRGISRAGSHELQGVSGTQTPMMPPPTALLAPGGTTWGTSNFALSNPTSPGLSGRGPNILHNNHAQNAHHNASNPLWGISTEAYDPSSTNISIMPPPYSFPYSSHTHTPNAGASNDALNFGNSLGGDGTTVAGQDGYFPDWLALPLDPLLNTWGDVSQYGPDVGGVELLDVLLSMGGNGG